jgi:hypothetical protein
MKKLLIALTTVALAIVISPAFAPHLGVAQTPPEPAIQSQQWPQAYTFTGATPAPYVLNVSGYKWCTFTASTGATFSSTTLTFSLSNDKGTTYENASGSSDVGATPAPVHVLTAVGKLSFPVQSHNLFQVAASGGGSPTSIPTSTSCST